MRILLVEDDRKAARLLARGLQEEGFVVDVAHSAEEGEDESYAVDYDVIVLDWMLPGKQGIDFCRDLRARAIQTPVLMLTARDATADRVAGLNTGADDYLTKPFEFEELLARIRALLRRASGRAEPVYEHKGVSINPSTREASVNGVPVVLSGREWAVLEPLLARPGLVLSRQQLEDKLYGWGDEVSSNAVEVYIHGLRKKLGPDILLNVRGVGYLVPKA